jgi:WD40 repeat protein
MKSPFKFLDSYTKDDREIFFGREREIEELYHRVFESKIMLVYGVSGTGKSSLIHCGLANKFQETDWLPIVIRRGGNIIESLAAGILSASITAQQTKLVSPADFKKSVKSLYLDHYKPVFFIFDQFEELFIFGDKEERRAFIHIVKTLTESDLQCRMIFVMREEYMAGVTEFERFIPTFFSNRVRIEKMLHRNALEAIKGPCKVFNISLEEGFGETLIEKLSPGSEDVELTYLQVFLDKIFRLAGGFLPPPGGELKGGSASIPELNGGLSFTLSLLQKTGNVSDLLGSFLEEQISLLDDPDTAMAVLKSFVSVKGTKRQMCPEEVSEYIQAFGKSLKESDLQGMLQNFVNLRILRDKDENGRYELRHDSLASKIYEKITLVEKEILEIRQFVENAYADYEKRRKYLETEDLNYIAPYIDKLFINKKLTDFIENSRKNITAKKRAFNRTLRYSFVGFFIIIISIVVYYFRSNISAKAEDLTIESFLQKDFSPSLSFQTALSAYQKDTTSTIAIKALFDAFYALLESGPYYDSLGNVLNPRKAIFDFTPCQSKIKYARLSEDGKYIYGYLDDNTVNIWDITGKLIFSKGDHSSQIVSLKFAPDNEYISAVFYDSTAVVWKTNGDLIYKTNVVFDLLNPLDVVSFSPEKNLISILKGNNCITIYNVNDSTYYELKGHTGEIIGAAFSPDGNFIASASKDSSIIVWQFNKSSGTFEKANQIKDFHGIVWSVDFAENSNYILSVSDSIHYPLLIHNLMGKAITFRYFLNAPEDTIYLAESPREYHGKYYAARFTADDAAIRISTFSDEMNLSKKTKIQPSVLSKGYNYHRIIYSVQGYQLNDLNKYLKRYGLTRYGYPVDPKLRFNYSYSYVDVSTKYIAVNLTGTGYSTLIHMDRLSIRNFKGVQPLFSPDEKYIICLNGESLELYPANEKEIIRLATVKSIFGKLEIDLNSWRHFMKDY